MRIVKHNLGILAAAGALILAMLAFAYANGFFRFFGPARRIVSPNGANNAFFCFDNPEDSGVSGSIYTMLGSHVTDLGPPVSRTQLQACPTSGCPGYLSWNGKAEGIAVHSGVYIYQIRAEEQNYTGALLVVR
ncbi:MAG: hypothetical protein NTY77_02440 [Elusimicrobia bacterium]|nr:hypothetical protein [Elusimicrobiota bacterium]